MMKSKFLSMAAVALIAAAGFSANVAADTICTGVRICGPMIGGVQQCQTNEVCQEVPAGGH